MHRPPRRGSFGRGSFERGSFERGPFAIVAVLLVMCFASTADAQRSRPRGRRPAAGAPESPATPETPANPFVEPGTGPASAPAAGAAAAAPSSSPSAGAPVGGAPPVADPGPSPPDLAPVRAELGQLMDDMVQARQRMAVLGQELFRTRIRIAVRDRAGDDQDLARFVVELDGAPVFRADAEIEVAERGRTVHEGALAPGPHVLTIETEQRARADAEVRYSQRESFRVQVHRERLTDVEIVLEDDSSMVDAFHDGAEGRYELRTRVHVVSRELPAGPPAPSAASAAPADAPPAGG